MPTKEAHRSLLMRFVHQPTHVGFIMSSDWCESIVGEIAAPVRNALVGGPFGSNLVSSDYVDAGIPVIRGQNMRGRWISGDFVFVTADKAKSLEANLAHPRDIIFTQRGTLGQVSLVPEKPFDCYLVSQSQMKLTVNPELADTLFLYYLFLTAEQQEYIHKNAIQTGVPHTNLGTLRATPVSLPPLSEQKAIAYFLGTLDDKIELNRKMNETLEATARLFFKDWFVDFGPTRAKAEGRPAYFAPELWSLFPDALDDDDKPVGWTIKPLDQIANFLNGLALQKYPSTGTDSIPVIKIAQLRTGNTTNSDRASVDLAKQYVVEDGDILFSWSGSLTHLVWTGGRGALNQHLFKVSSSNYPKWFFFYWISEHMPNFQAIAASKATTMGHIQRHHLTEALTIVPSDSVLDSANQMISPLFEKILSNSLESRTLAQTRDLLLPKLLSGEIRLRDAEKIAGQAL